MAAVNNVTKDWNSVLSTAQAAFAENQRQINTVGSEARFAKKNLDDIKIALANQKRFYQEALVKFRPNPVYVEILPLQEAYEKDPTNPAKKAAWEKALAEFRRQEAIYDKETAGYPGIISSFTAQYERALARFTPADAQFRILVDQEAQLKTQINEANTQLAAQKAGTTPVNTTTVSATSVPGSNNPGNAAVATTTTTTTPTSILKTKPDPIAITADVDPISGRAEPIAVTNGDPSLTITDEPLAVPAINEAELAALGAEGQASVEAALLEAQGEATAQDQANFAAKEDWRVRLSLAPDSEYLYNAKPDPGILKPLLETDGVIFPYTPSISVNYAASYEQTNLVHSNYKIFQYSGSGVDSVSLSCAFTAQDDYEANYLLAVIHFFRSMTKMFYGQDDNPKNGTPPPLCYMFGMGGYQFAAHPLAIQGFSYTLPDDVDYIKTTSASPAGTPRPSKYTASDTRLAGTGVGKGGKGPGPNFSTSPGNDTVTWVPTRIQMTINCVPIMSRNAVSNRFSLRDYASGVLLNGTRVPGGGMW
jgi:hypothetical protein